MRKQIVYHVVVQPRFKQHFRNKLNEGAAELAVSFLGYTLLEGVKLLGKKLTSKEVPAAKVEQAAAE